MTKRLLLLSVFLFAAAALFGQSSGGNRSSGGNGVCTTIVANLNNCSNLQKGTLATVKDGSTTSDCSTGGGANVVTCIYNGSTWAFAGNSGSNPNFNQVGPGTNTGALLMGTGGSLGPTGTGTITATNVQTGVGLAPTVDGVLGVNTTSHLPVFGSNSSTLTFGQDNTTGGSATNSTFFLEFVGSNSSGIQNPTTTANLNFNPSTGNLSSTTFTGAGAFSTVSASSTVSGTGFSTWLTGQLVSPPPIGGTTPAAGAFTTLSASSTVSGAGFSTYLASPPAIGGTSPAAGHFTTLSATGQITATEPTGSIWGSATGGAEGAGTINATGLYVNGTPVSTAGGYTFQVNGSNLVSTDTVNMNSTTPAAGSNGYNITVQTSKAGSTDSVSWELVGDGVSSHCFLGTGLGNCPSGFANPMTTLGDMIAENSTPAAARLAGPTNGNSTYYLTSTPSSSTAQLPAWAVPGVPIDVESGATPSLQGDNASVPDRAKVLETTNGTGSTALSVAQAGSTNFGSNFPFVHCNSGTVIATDTPTTSTVNGNATLILPAQPASGNPACAFWWSDNSNWWAALIPATDANGKVPNTSLTSSSITVNGQSIGLGSSGNVNSGATAHTVAVNEGNGSALAGAGPGTTNAPLLSGGSSADPSYSSILYPTAATQYGIAYASSTTQLAVGSAPTAHGVLLGEAGAPTSTGAGTANAPLLSGGNSADPAYSSILYPTALTSGGVLYGSSTTQLSSSALLAANALVVGGGAGTAPTTGNGDFTYATHTLTGGTSGIVDLSGMTGSNAFKIPSQAGETSNGTSSIAYDTTNKNTHIPVNNADALAVGESSAITSNAIPKSASSSYAGVTASSMSDNGTVVSSSEGFAIGTTVHGVAIGEGASAPATTTAAGTANQILKSGGSSADPSYIDFPEHWFIPAGNCNNATAGAGWSIPASNAPTVACRAGSNNLGGALTWANNNTTTNAQFTVQLPFDWDTSQQPYINIIYGSGANTSGTVKWTFSSACTKSDGSVTDDPSFNAESASTGKTMATANRTWSENLQFTAMTSGNNCIAGSTVIVKVTSGNGTATSSVNVYGVTLTIPRLLVVQAN